MQFNEHTIDLYDLAAGTTHITLPEEFTHLTKLQLFALGAAAVGSDVVITEGDAAPAAGQAGFVAPNNLYLGTATVAGQMFTATGFQRGKIHQLV